MPMSSIMMNTGMRRTLRVNTAATVRHVAGVGTDTEILAAAVEAREVADEAGVGAGAATERVGIVTATVIAIMNVTATVIVTVSGGV